MPRSYRRIKEYEQEIFRRTTAKYLAIYRHKYKYSITDMCKFFSVSRSGYYDFVNRMNIPAKDLPLAENFFSILKTECIHRIELEAYDKAR